MIGHDGCAQTVGVIPCAISWLFKLINRKRDKTWANISVSVTAVEVCGENNAIRDLLSEVDADNCKETYKPDAYLVEDPIYGTQVKAIVECAENMQFIVQSFSKCNFFKVYI